MTQILDLMSKLMVAIIGPFQNPNGAYQAIHPITSACTMIILVAIKR